MRSVQPYIACVLAAVLTIFSSVWCCCVVGHAAAETAHSAATPAVSQIASSDSHSCCSLPAASAEAEESVPASSDAPEDCNCDTLVAETPSRWTNVSALHASFSEMPAFHLAWVQAAWLLPVSIQTAAAAQVCHSPPPALADSLLSLSCQFTT